MRASLVILAAAASLAMAAGLLFLVLGGNGTATNLISEKSAPVSSLAPQAPRNEPKHESGKTHAPEVKKLRGAFEDRPETQPPRQDEPVLVSVPRGADPAGLQLLDLNPALPLPASLAAPDPALALPPKLEAQKQEIARHFLQQIAVARRKTMETAALSAAWTHAQSTADQNLRAHLGINAFRYQFEQVNPGTEARTLAARLERQARMNEEHFRNQAASNSNAGDTEIARKTAASYQEGMLVNTGMYLDPVVDKAMAAARLENQRRMIEEHFGSGAPSSSALPR